VPGLVRAGRQHTPQRTRDTTNLANIGVNHLIFVTNGPWPGGELDVVLEAIEPVASIAV
jgi:hypothetical protein